MSERKSFGAFILDYLQTIVLALAIFLIVYLFLFQPHQVRGESMLPNFANNEFLLTDKLSYRFGTPKRADVIVFAAPPTPGEDYIKRIVGLPGQAVQLKDGALYIDGQQIAENYLLPATRTEGGTFLPEGKTFRLEQDEYFVLGDNRNNSSDSRRWGPVKKKKIVGRAWLVYWPPSKFGLRPN